MSFTAVRSVNLREQVVEQIRTAIIEGRLKPNDHIAETALTSQLGVSRTPVREALILLESEGLVVSLPHRGCFVRTFTVKDVAEIFSLRTTLENFAASLSIYVLNADDYQHLRRSIETQREALNHSDFKLVRSVDMSFHQFIVANSKHDMLIRNWREIVAQIAALLYLRAEAIEDYDEYQSLRDHTAIVEALENKDLPCIYMLNEQINARVAAECQRAVATLHKTSTE
jgi:DNA-binding GntR family transcriptional regulator